jgi:ankyrin repeat protein
MEDLLLGIQWILFASRPLTGREFFFALHAGQHRQQPESLRGWDGELLSDADMEHFVSSTSKGLAEITTSKNLTVQFIHESARDFLLKDRGIQQLWPRYTQIPQFEALGHDSLKTCCAFFLQVDVSTVIPPSERKAVDARRAGSRRLKTGEAPDLIRAKFPFLHYAVSNLFHHSNHGATVVSQAELLETVDLASWVSLHNIFEKELDNVYSLDVTKAYLFSASNWVELLRLALQSDKDVVSPNEEFRHPLIVASANGHEAAVRLLLATEGMDVQPQDSSGRTPLRCAIANKHEEIFDLLLEHQGSDTALADHRGRTPLQIAHQLHRLSMIKKLIQTNSKLAAAAQSIQDVAILAEIADLGFNIEDLILAGDAVIHVKNRQGKTPLQLAIDQDKHRLIKYLAQRPGPPTDPHSVRRVANLYALSVGKGDMVQKVLLGQRDTGLMPAMLRAIHDGSGVESGDGEGGDPEMVPVGSPRRPQSRVVGDDVMSPGAAFNLQLPDGKSLILPITSTLPHYYLPSSSYPKDPSRP